MRKQHDRLGVILFWILMLFTFLISALRKQQTTSAPTSNRTDTDAAAQKPQSSQPNTTPHPEALVDSGMIEVALVIATVGFLLYQFGDELGVLRPVPFTDLTMKQLGKIVVFVGIWAAVLLHSSFLLAWMESRRRKIGYLDSAAIPVLLGHIIIYIVLVVAMCVAALSAGGQLGLMLGLLAMLILLLVMRTRKS